MPSNDTTQYEELYLHLQGYFEFRLCPHNTRRRPAQQARSKQSQNLIHKNTLNVKQENKINVSIDLKHTQTNKRCPVPFLFIVVPKSFPAIQFLSLYLTVFNRVVLTSTSLEERAAVFVFFHFLLNKLAAGQRLVIKCDHGRLIMDTALKVLDEIPTSRGGFLCSLRSAMALLGWQLVGQVDNNFLDKILCASSWI